MVLTVPFDEFASAVKAHLATPNVYVEKCGTGSKLTASGAGAGILISTISELSPSKASEVMEKAGINVEWGQWSLDLPEVTKPLNGETLHVVAIAYNSRGLKPGLWMDAYPYQPTPVEALRGMYDEFQANAEMENISFEDFTNTCNATVVVGNAIEIAEWVRKNTPETES